MLRAEQKDEDILPPYVVPDGILERLRDLEESKAEIVAAGHQRHSVSRINALVYASEYERSLAAPGARLSRAPSGSTGAIRS